MAEYVKEWIPVRYAESEMGEQGILRGGDKTKIIPISFTLYVLKTDSHCVLVDAGCDELDGFEMRNMLGPVKALENQGISTEEITDVIITHAHDDHIAGIDHFPRTRVYIQEDEYIYGQKFIPKNNEVITFKEECTVAGCLKLKKIGGHSIGSCIVEFSMDDERYIVCGDECYSSECFWKKVPTGVSVCPEKSQKFIEEYGNGDYKILMCHDFQEGVVCLPKKEED